MAPRPSPLDQDLAAYELGQKGKRVGEEPLASSEQQPGHLAGVVTASPAGRKPELLPPSHSLRVAPHPSLWSEHFNNTFRNFWHQVLK